MSVLLPEAPLSAPALPISIVVGAYQMSRELPRTLRSFSAAYQDFPRDQYEVIVVDNGSSPAVSAGDFAELDLWLTVLHMAKPTQSPVPAINRGIEIAKGDLVGAFIDGARLASPGMLRQATNASRISERPVIATLGFHLGPAVQMRSVPAGYDKTAEDALLASIGWPADGQRLFEIATFAGSSRGGWFAPMSECNGLFMKKDSWRELGGFDPGFESPGGGLCNLDMYRRACQQAGAQVIVLLGQGTFHQVHGGIATNNPNSPWEIFGEEYLRLRGEPYTPPAVDPIYLGTLPPSAMPSVEYSVRALRVHSR